MFEFLKPGPRKLIRNIITLYWTIIYTKNVLHNEFYVCLILYSCKLKPKPDFGVETCFTG